VTESRVGYVDENWADGRSISEAVDTSSVRLKWVVRRYLTNFLLRRYKVVVRRSSKLMGDGNTGPRIKSMEVSEKPLGEAHQS
jgi:hypothetical protein